MAAAPGEDEWQPSADDIKRVDAQIEPRWRQGDVGRPGIVVHVANLAVPLVVEDRDALAQVPDGDAVRTIDSIVDAVAVVSQTCDVVRSSAIRPFVKLSPVVTLTGDDLKLASAGRMPRYAALPGLGEGVFADLDRCTTITKSTLAGMEHDRGCPDDTSLAAFGRQVAHHYGRFAYPRFVEEALAPLGHTPEQHAQSERRDPLLRNGPRRSCRASTSDAGP